MPFLMTIVTAILGFLGFSSVSFLLGRLIALRTDGMDISKIPSAITSNHPSAILVAVLFFGAILLRGKQIGKYLTQLGLRPFPEQGKLERMITLAGPPLGLVFGLIAGAS